MEYIDDDGEAVSGIIRLMFCKEAPKPKACESISEISFAYLTYKQKCVSLSLDESSPPNTDWKLKTEGERGHGEKFIFDGKNPENFKYDVEVIFTCNDEKEEPDVTGKYNFNTKKFNVSVLTKHACRLNIGEMAMVFYHFRFFIMVICMALGIYINYFGIYKVKKTLVIFGFIFTFFFSLFIFSAIIHKSKTISI